MRKYIVVYKDEEIEDRDSYLQWKDADIKTEFATYEEAMDYIMNIQPVGVELDIMLIED